jgi:hypothetical protein
MDRQRRTHCMASMLTRFVSSGFLPVGTSKILVYAASVDNEGVLPHHTVDAWQIICNYPSIFELIRQSMMRRAEVCIQSHGGHFEHLL